MERLSFHRFFDRFRIPYDSSRKRFVFATGALVLNPFEQLAMYRPLTIVYADGLGGTSPIGRPFYDIDLFINWKTAEAQNPSNPNIEEWMTTLYDKMRETDAEGSDIDLVGHSAGGAVIIALALAMVTPGTRFYNVPLAEKVTSLTILAPPNALDPSSATRKSLDGRNEYKKIFKRYPDTTIQEFIRVFSGKTTIIVGQSDDELRDQGIAMAKTLHIPYIMVPGGHGMEGSTQVIKDMFRKRYTDHRLKQSKKTA